MISPFRRPLATNRLLVILGILLGAFVLILMRLYFLQVVQAPFFAQLAHQRYTTTVTLPSPRGILYDRNKFPLAVPRQALSAFVDRSTVTNSAAMGEYLEEFFPLAYQEWKNNPNQNFFWLTRHISLDRRNHIHRQNPDIHFLYEPSRWYAPDDAPEITGFTNIDGRGISGIERHADQELAGKPTTLRYQKEAGDSGLYFVHHVVKPGTSGQDVTLSVDHQLQFLVRQQLEDATRAHKAQRACAIILDPTTGQIHSMAQTPIYNPNNPADVAPEHRKNHCVSSSHEFGSLMHIFSGLAAFAEGITTPDELINAEGKAGYIDGVKIENRKEFGTIPFWQVIADASNVGIAKVCRRLGPLLFEHLHRLGFTTATGIELPGERSGFVPPPERWSTATPLKLSYGYESMCSLMQIARAMGVIANNGTVIRPTVYYNKRMDRGLQLYDAEPIQHIRDTLVRGAQKHEMTIPGYTVLGQIGTAHMLKNGAHSPHEKLLSCAGIIEKDGYRRVIVATIERPHLGTRSADTTIASLFTRLATLTALHENG